MELNSAPLEGKFAPGLKEGERERIYIYIGACASARRRETVFRITISIDPSISSAVAEKGIVF